MWPSFDPYKLYPGCVIGTTNVLNPISDIIAHYEGGEVLNPYVATHIQIASRRNDLNKVVEMTLTGIHENDASIDKEGIFKHYGNHVVFVAAAIAEDDYTMQEKSNDLLKYYLKVGYEYDLPYLFKWFGLDVEEKDHKRICSTLHRQWCIEMGLSFWDTPLYDPKFAQFFYQEEDKMLWTCYKGRL